MRTAAILTFALLSSAPLAADWNDEATQYVRSFATALGWANEAVNTVDAASKVTGPEGDVEFLYANKRAKDFYERASAELSPYQKSHAEFIARSASAAIVVFAKYGELIDQSVVIQKDLNQNLAALKRGEHVDVDGEDSGCQRKICGTSVSRR